MWPRLTLQHRADLDGRAETGGRDSLRERDRGVEVRRVVEVVPVQLASGRHGRALADARLPAVDADRRRRTGGLQLVAVEHAGGPADLLELSRHLLLIPGRELPDRLVGAVEADLEHELHLILLTWLVVTGKQRHGRRLAGLAPRLR